MTTPEERRKRIPQNQPVTFGDWLDRNIGLAKHLAKRSGSLAIDPPETVKLKIEVETLEKVRRAFAKYIDCDDSKGGQ